MGSSKEVDSSLPPFTFQCSWKKGGRACHALDCLFSPTWPYKALSRQGVKSATCQVHVTAVCSEQKWYGEECTLHHFHVNQKQCGLGRLQIMFLVSKGMVAHPCTLHHIYGVCKCEQRPHWWPAASGNRSCWVGPACEDPFSWWCGILGLASPPRLLLFCPHSILPQPAISLYLECT